MADNGTQPLTVKELTAGNFKGLTAFRWQNQNRQLVILHGPNGAGKSSALQAFLTALAGQAAAPVRVIKDGETEAHVGMVLSAPGGDELHLLREWSKSRDDSTKASFTLTRVGVDGSKTRVTKPQSAIDELFEMVTLDPAALYRERDGQKRARIIQRAANLDAPTLDRLQQDIERAESARRDANKALASADGNAASLAKIAPKEAPNPNTLNSQADELDAKLAEHAAHNSIVSEHDAGLRMAQIEADRLAQDITRQEAVLAELRTRQQGVINRVSQLREKTPGELVPSAQLDALRSEALTLRQQASAAREQLRLWESMRLERDRLAKAQAVADQSAELVDAARNQRREFISAGLRKAGLADIIDLDDEGRVMMYGRPWEDVSGSERLLASARAAMATRPGVRLLLLDEADALGPQAIEQLSAWAAEQGFLVMLAGCWLQSESAETIEIDAGEIVSVVSEPTQ